jgi:hypothetical protein
VLNLSFYAFHIWTIVAILGNRQHRPVARCYTATSANHKQYPRSPKRPHHPRASSATAFHHRSPTAAVTAVAADIHQFARIRGTRHVHTDLKEAAMVNLFSPMPDEQRFTIEMRLAAQPRP